MSESSQTRLFSGWKILPVSLRKRIESIVQVGRTTPDPAMSGYGMLRRSHQIDAKQRMYGPAVRLKMISELGEREKLHQCIRPLEWS